MWVDCTSMLGLAAERGRTDRLDLSGSDWQRNDETHEQSRHSVSTTSNHILHRCIRFDCCYTSSTSRLYLLANSMLYCLHWASHDDRWTSKREACCIADLRASFQATRLSSCPHCRTGGIVRSQGQFEVLHVRLICGQHLLVRGTAEQVHTTTQTDTTSTSTSLQSLTADLPV